MMDPRIPQLAGQLVNHSTQLEKGDRVLIDLYDAPVEIAVALVRTARKAGALPFVKLNDSRIARELSLEAESARLEIASSLGLEEMKTMSAYIAVRGSHNISELSDVPADILNRIMKAMRPVLDHRVRHTRWVVLRWPNPAMAQQAGMSSEAFEAFFFRVCLLDYAGLTPAMNALAERMNATDQVHIKGPGSDLRFSIRDIPAIVCNGNHNIPDGEVFTAPVKDSVEGVIQFNTPTIYQGAGFDSVRLTFKNGRIADASSNQPARLQSILDSDEGARYVGEFALGFNNEILEPMRDILFDEKIGGSFHFTPGQAYEEADNGNRSQVHWDLVCIQRPDYGGGEIWFDDTLIRKDGRFLPAELEPLNPKT
ncbi:MAG TPA: aminopeptidase [Verrucomicrobiales bacterium]|nr:aminopeptidase [Verrucomicrobiales bacterium]